MSLARRIAALAPQVEAADFSVEAGSSLVEAGQIGLGLADRVVDLREADAADPEVALMPGLVELMATSGEQVDRVAELLADARTALDAIPPEAASQIREARDLVAGPIATYAPLLDTYRELDGVLPGLLGWGEEKRYLVLAQNPAELRPSGGYTGTVGTITLRDGAIVEQDFVDTYGLSVQEGLPFVDPPGRADRLPARRGPVLAPGGCQLVAGLPDRGPQGGRALRHRGRPGGRRRGHRHHDVRARSSTGGHRPGGGSRIRRDRPAGRRDHDAPRRDARHGRIDRGSQGRPGRTGHRDAGPPAVPAAGALGGDPGRA